MRHFQHDAVILPPQRRTSLSPGEQRQILIVEMLADEQAPCRALSQLPHPHRTKCARQVLWPDRRHRVGKGGTASGHPVPVDIERPSGHRRKKGSQFPNRLVSIPATKTPRPYGSFRALADPPHHVQQR